MEIGKQIRKYRMEAKLSQDELADKIYVTRQTISNWENDRNYPDIRSLVLLSSVFGISLDNLVKGDVETMKEQIDAEDIRRFKRDQRVYLIMLAGMVILPMPLVRYLKEWGIILWLVWAAVSIWWSLRIEKHKKTHDIHTYKEIIAFLEGRRLDELEKQREIGKRHYQYILVVLAVALVGLAVVLLLRRLLFGFRLDNALRRTQSSRRINGFCQGLTS